MKHIKKIAQLSSIGAMSVISANLLLGCAAENTQEQAKGAFVVIEEVAPKEYKIKEQYPSDETRVILKQLDGTERILSKEEMDALIGKEAKKIDEGTSNLTNGSSMSGGGMSLGETLLASAAGAVLGSWIGSKLFNNQNFQNNKRGAFSSPSAYQRSTNSFNKPSNSGSRRSSGFFGGGAKKSSGFFGG